MKKIYFIAIISVFVTISGFAQNRIGGIRIFPVILQEKGDSLYLEMDVQVDGKAMNNCQSWTIMPFLVTADSSYYLEMPTVLINGKLKAKHFRRKVKFGNKYLFTHFPAYKVDKKKTKMSQ